MILVDSNVLLDVLTDEQVWADWSQGQLEKAAGNGAVIINEVIFAEVSARYASVRDVAYVLDQWHVTIVSSPLEALFLAGKVFLQYRNAGGLRTSVLPDFFIGAHAVTSGLPLLTRDVRRYRTYFPRIDLIAPDDPA